MPISGGNLLQSQLPSECNYLLQANKYKLRILSLSINNLLSSGNPLSVKFILFLKTLIRLVEVQQSPLRPRGPLLCWGGWQFQWYHLRLLRLKSLPKALSLESLLVAFRPFHRGSRAVWWRRYPASSWTCSPFISFLLMWSSAINYCDNFWSPWYLILHSAFYGFDVVESLSGSKKALVPSSSDFLGVLIFTAERVPISGLSNIWRLSC